MLLGDHNSEWSRSWWWGHHECSGNHTKISMTTCFRLPSDLGWFSNANSIKTITRQTMPFMPSITTQTRSCRWSADPAVKLNWNLFLLEYATNPLHSPKGNSSPQASPPVCSRGLGNQAQSPCTVLIPKITTGGPSLSPLSMEICQLVNLYEATWTRKFSAQNGLINSVIKWFIAY